MEGIVNYFVSRNLNIEMFLQAAGLVIVVLLGLALSSLFIYGKVSILTRSVSSAIGILFIYAVTIVFGVLGPEFQRFIAPLPFISIEDGYMSLFRFQGDITSICAQVLNMVILAFLMNLADSILPTGKHPVTWILLRCLAVISGMALHLLSNYLLIIYLPEGLMTYAPAVLLGVLVALLLTGSLKVVVGLFLITVNPVIAALYTFFFASIIGKQITKAVLTTGILTGLTLWLQEMGVSKIYIAQAAWEAYIPLILLLVAAWYVVGRLLSIKK